MSTFRILPIEQSAANRVREARDDGHGNREIQPTVAQEPGAYPCRVCLEEAGVGEEVLLFSYCPFHHPVPYQNLGPIFVHAHSCVPYDRPGSVPELMRRRLLALRGYDADGRMKECDVVQGAELESVVDRFFRNSEVAVIHAHNARAGCFVCTIERAM